MFNYELDFRKHFFIFGDNYLKIQLNKSTKYNKPEVIKSKKIYIVK